MSLRSLVAVAALLAATAAPLADAAAPKITNKGVGAVKLGRTFDRLHRAHLIGHLRKGCELAANLRVARLRAPLHGTVEFFKPKLKAFQITVTGGAKARGVGVGATVAEVKAAFPKAKVRHVLGITVVTVPRSGGGRLEFGVSPDTGKVDQIGIPSLAFCE